MDMQISVKMQLYRVTHRFRSTDLCILALLNCVSRANAVARASVGIRKTLFLRDHKDNQRQI